MTCVGAQWTEPCLAAPDGLHHYKRPVVPIDFYNEAREHLQKLVDWGHGEADPIEPVRRDWEKAEAFLARAHAPEGTR
jgi:hypothetical protein